MIPRIGSAALAAAVLLAVGGALALPTGASDAAAARKPAKRKPATIEHGHVVIAVARAKKVRIYARANGKRPVATLGLRTRHGARRVFLVDWKGKRWTWPKTVRVFVPLRPNGRRGWVRAKDVRFLVNPYHVTVRLDDRRLVVWRRGKVVLRSRIAIGRALTPTPAGKYFVTELLRQPNPRGAYGPYAFGTSAYSDVIQSFGGGPGQVGIHGTNRPSVIGTEVSHGCIRVRNATIRRLARMLPLGTPVSIVVDRFDGRAARELVAKQVRYGPRPAGSPAARKLAAFLRKQLPNGRFQAVPEGLRNVVGVVRGRNPKRVVVVGAHYDTYDKRGFVGANDGASGTAIVTQLAKTIEPRELRPTVVFALFDGEEALPGTDFRTTGMRGSRVAAQAYKHAQAMILLDMVGERGLRVPRELGSNKKLWARLRQAAARVGARQVFPPRTRGRVLDDHVPFRDLGIPAIDVIDFDFACWHKLCDRYRLVSAQSLDFVGESVYELLRRL